jgi:dephospho-CoA kinase
VLGIDGKLWYPSNMFVVVITGGLGAGKSTAADFFRRHGAVVLDLDDIAKHTMVKGSPVLQRVADEFGPDVLLADGSLDKAALAREAFGSPERAAALNAIVHPAVAREVGPALSDLRLMQQPPEMVVIEVPLLAEAPIYAELADAVLAVVAPESMRLSRAVARGMSERDAKQRIALQATDAERSALADRVVINDGEREALDRQLEDFLASFKTREWRT